MKRMLWWVGSRGVVIFSVVVLLMLVPILLISPRIGDCMLAGVESLATTILRKLIVWRDAT